MYQHTMTFDSFQAKRIAIDWIEENVDYLDLGECLTEKKCQFFTDIELRRKQKEELLRCLEPKSYLVKEL